MGGKMTRRDDIACRVERALEPILDGIASQRSDAYRSSLLHVAAALRAEAAEIEALASESK